MVRVRIMEWLTPGMADLRNGGPPNWRTKIGNILVKMKTAVRTYTWA